jgi:hypothetical protein
MLQSACVSMRVMRRYNICGTDCASDVYIRYYGNHECYIHVLPCYNVPKKCGVVCALPLAGGWRRKSCQFKHWARTCHSSTPPDNPSHSFPDLHARARHASVRIGNQHSEHDWPKGLQDVSTA